MASDSAINPVNDLTAEDVNVCRYIWLNLSVIWKHSGEDVRKRSISLDDGAEGSPLVAASMAQEKNCCLSS